MTSISTAEPQPSARDQDNSPVTIIRPSRGWVSLRLNDLWEYREVFYFLVWRDFKVRYKQTLLGISWAILQPVVSMIVFSIFFGRLAKIDSQGLPYPIFSYAALLPWSFFADGISKSANSLASNAGLVQKVYFPRLIVPSSAVISGFPDFLLAFLVLIVMMVYYGIYPTASALLWLPLFLLLALVTSLGCGLWLSALNAMYRDIRYVVPFMIQVWLFATPVAYPSTLLEEPWHTLYGLNPMAGVVEGFRWALLGVGDAPGPMVLISALVAIAVLISGAYFFRRIERTFADLI